jgi:hypothetical protein
MIKEDETQKVGGSFNDYNYSWNAKFCPCS